MTKGFDMFIIKPFNLTFFALIAIFVLITHALVVISRKLSPEKTRKMLIWVYIFVMVIFLFYKVFMPGDTEYMKIYHEVYGEFTVWNELPLAFCNISLWLFILALATNKRPLYGACFVMSLFGPLMAIVMPTYGFSGVSLLSTSVAGYYITHIAGMMIPFLCLGTGVFRLRKNDVLKAVITLIGIAAIVFGITTIIRVSGLCPFANYFFVYKADGNPILLFLYNIIKLPFLYELPLLAAATPVVYLIAWIIKKIWPEECVTD